MKSNLLGWFSRSGKQTGSAIKAPEDKVDEQAGDTVGGQVKNSSPISEKLSDSASANASASTDKTNSAQTDDGQTGPIHVCPAFDLREQILDNVRVLFPIVQNSEDRMNKETPPPGSKPEFNLIVTGTGTAFSAKVVFHEAKAASDEFHIFLSVGPRDSEERALHDMLGFTMMLLDRQALYRHKETRMHRWGDYHCYARSRDPDT